MLERGKRKGLVAQIVKLDNRLILTFRRTDDSVFDRSRKFHLTLDRGTIDGRDLTTFVLEHADALDIIEALQRVMAENYEVYGFDGTTHDPLEDFP